MAGLPAAFISAWLVWCLAEVGEFCEAIAIGEKGCELLRRSITPSAW